MAIRDRFAQRLSRAVKELRHAERMLSQAETEAARLRHRRRLLNATQRVADARRDLQAASMVIELA